VSSKIFDEDFAVAEDGGKIFAEDFAGDVPGRTHPGWLDLWGHDGEATQGFAGPL
jgi:hypothetical protein